MRTRGFEVVTLYESSGVHLPERKTGASTGYDFAAAESVEIAPGEGKLVPTGVKAYMQENEVLLVYIRSSAAFKKHLMLMNGVGVIDADYYGNAENEGHILIPIFNYGAEAVRIAAGDRAGDFHHLPDGGRGCGGTRRSADGRFWLDGRIEF